MRGFTKEEAEKHKASLQEFFKANEDEEINNENLEELIDDKRELLQQRDELVEVLEKIVTDEHIVFEPARTEALELINKIKGKE